MKIDLDGEHLKMLEDKYRVANDSNSINYSQFLSDINIVFTLTGLEKDPLADPPQYKKGTQLDPNDVLTD